MNWFKSLLINKADSLSSKRFCGMVGWFVVIFILIYCTISLIQAPTMIETFMLSCAGLLGLDTVTGIWRKRNDV